MTNILELMQRHAGRSLGPIQQHRFTMNEQFMIVENSSPGFKDDTGLSKSFVHHIGHLKWVGRLLSTQIKLMYVVYCTVSSKVYFYMSTFEHYTDSCFYCFPHTHMYIYIDYADFGRCKLQVFNLW